MRWHHHDTDDSTSERAFEELAAGRAEHLDVHTAEAQTKGRGRLGRAWVSPPGAGLYMSIVLLPGPPPLDPAALTMAAGLAVLDAVGGAGGLRLKWPNDVVAGGAKLAGILVESRGLDPTAPHYVVGIGVNLQPGGVAVDRPVTSLAELGAPVDGRELASAVAAAVETRARAIRHRPAALAADYLAATELEGRRVRVRAGTAEWVGVLERIELGRGLCLDGDDGPRWIALEHLQGVEAV